MTEKNTQILGFRIKELRKGKGLRQAELADLLHVSQQTVGAWEIGRRSPSTDTINTLADYFGVTTDYLLGRESKADMVHSMTVDEALGTIMSYDGKPVSDHDKRVMKDLLEAYLRSKGE
ncbi:helix-turn-helix domain-containing protein [Ligilactobacillus saerimneri]|uniref:helix-turn-helix domain-containing protein n=1 Tax=Ligilactobacillus saerimneri TaxID=228229 RepID=UPI0024BBC1AF|nr:helix-turn-helix transcriptional regulator [Ligilactobacillus saerimneri]